MCHTHSLTHTLKHTQTRACTHTQTHSDSETPRTIMGHNPKEEIVKAFQLFDDVNMGKISLRNLHRVARELGKDMSEEKLKAMVNK